MAKPRNANHFSTPQRLSRKIHEAESLLIKITTFILLIATLLQIILHEAIPVFRDALQKLLGV